MYAKEAKEIFLRELTPFMESYGYKYKKSKYRGYLKITDSGYDRMGFGFLNYFPEQHPAYIIDKRFNVVEDIFKILVDKFQLNEGNEITLWFSYESLHRLHTNGYLPGVETEEQAIESCKKIKEFMLAEGFPMLEKYSTLQAIDAIINTNKFWDDDWIPRHQYIPDPTKNGEDFWDTDWMHPFTLGGGFWFKRLIIAKLCNNPNYEKIKEYHLSRHLEARRKEPNRVIPLVDGKSSLEYLIDVLLK